MLITREIDYSLRVLRALSDGEQATAATIAQREVLPQQFTYKIIKKLAKAGMVQIVRGSGGGYRLTADLSRITLYDLLQGMGSEEWVNACMDPTYICPWREEYQRPCDIHCRLREIQNTIDQEIKNHTIQEILTREKQG